jgi:predicted LPLAT superfamily acyltransferase
MSGPTHSRTMTLQGTHWRTRPERGSLRLLRVMRFISLHAGRRLSRALLYLIASYFFLFAPTARLHARRYLRRALAREPTATDRFRQILSFATMIHDRVYLINARHDLFDITVEGEDVVREAQAKGRGAFLLGAHLGSFEIVSSLGMRHGLTVAMAMYEANARKINAALAALNPKVPVEIIGLGQLEAMLHIRERLDAGVFVGMLADRSLGDEPACEMPLLGAPAMLPAGPMRAAALMRRPVIFMAGLHRGGNRYHVVFERLADFSAVDARNRDVALSAGLQRYAQLLERCCRSDPYNWYNFYDFWHEDRV